MTRRILLVVLFCLALLGVWTWYEWQERERTEATVPPARIPVEPPEEVPAPDPRDVPLRTAPVPEPPPSPTAASTSPRPDSQKTRAYPPPERLPSGLIIPVAGVHPEDLVDTFEEARAQGRTHDAIDIIAPQRTPVLAAAEGRIVRLFDSDKGGITLYQLAPDDRTVYYYAHLDGYAEGVAKGVFAEQGAVLGYVGDTGNAVPGNYHLHFAIWKTDDPADFWDGEPVNPYPLLGGMLE